jgi:biotin---protein ligase
MSSPAGEADEQSYTVYCADDAARDALLSTRSAVLKRAVDGGTRLRLHSAGDAPPPPPGALDVPAMQAALSTGALGRVLVYTARASSTQDLLRARFRGLPEGAVATAEVQTAGRGRRGAEWVSPIGSVSFSMLLALPISAPERLTFVQYVAALAAVECVQGRLEWRCIPLRIKWPNDLYVDGKKVGGVLCEASTDGTRFDVVVGVGLNMYNAEPTFSLEAARLAGGGSPAAPIERHLFMAAYFDAFERLYLEFSRSQGFDTLLKRYLDAWLHSGQRVTLRANGGRPALILGLAPNGYIRVRCEDNGEVLDLAPDVTSLDLTSGVVRDKAVGVRSHAPSPAHISIK